MRELANSVILFSTDLGVFTQGLESSLYRLESRPARFESSLTGRIQTKDTVNLPSSHDTIFKELVSNGSSSIVGPY